MDKKHLIYIVDDEVDWLEILCEELSEVYQVKSFPNPELMFKQLNLNQLPSVFLLDIYMPGMTGVETTEKLVKMGVQRPILIMSGSADRKDALNALQLGVFDIIEKPTSLDRILGTMERAVSYFELIVLSQEIVSALEDMVSKMLVVNQNLETQFLDLQQQLLLKGFKKIENATALSESLRLSEHLAESKNKLEQLRKTSNRLAEQLSKDNKNQKVNQLVPVQSKRAA